MTQPAQQQTPAVQSFSVDGKELPFEFPRCSRLLTEPPFPAAPNTKPEEKAQPLLWQQGEGHPLIDGHIIVRMYVLPGVGAEVYSVERPKDGLKGAVRGGVRQTIPWPQIRIAEEVMDLASFCDEIVNAEKGDDGGEIAEPASTSAPPAPTVNGSPS